MANQIYTIVNTVALVFWILLIFLPQWKFTKILVRSGGGILLFAGMYVFWLLLYSSNLPIDSFATLEGLSSLFSSPNLLLAGWLHYLAFDLFAGLWIRQDAEKWQVPTWLVIPSLLFTFLLGPSGLLLYWTGRGILKSKWTLFQG